MQRRHLSSFPVRLMLATVSMLLCSSGIATASAPGVKGRVVDESQPVGQAAVYAYEVASFVMHEVETDRRGRFLFDHLPAGMYQLVAFKPGFRPSVELLLRRTTDSLQEIEIELRRDETGAGAGGEDYWTVRGRVPADVLREIQNQYAAHRAAEGLQLAETDVYHARMQALSGVEQVGGLSAQHMAAAFDVQGHVGTMELGIDGRYETLTPRGESDAGLDGEVRSVALKLASANEQRFRLATSTGQLAGLDPVDLEHYQLEWAGKTGRSAETRVTARYVEETGYHQAAGPLALVPLPTGSETWALEGTYLQAFNDDHSLRAGASYRQRTTAEPLFLADESDERLGLFGVAASQIQPRVLVEYGLYSTVRDGSLSLMPQGGVVVDLGGGWSAESSFARRVDAATGDGDGLVPTAFDTAFYSDRDSCYEVGESCYEVSLTRRADAGAAGQSDNELRIGAIHREYAETLRLYFSQDFFDRLENVFLVEGDRLPELRFSLGRRIAPKVLARLESNFASGGGGVVYATDSAQYENNVRYLVTSLDTQFQSTQTGVFLAFHHLEQSLQRRDDGQAVARNVSSDSQVEMQRLQLMLTQDLSALVDLASRWAVRLNMELSRGATPYTLTADDEVHKKLTGGFAVSF